MLIRLKMLGFGLRALGAVQGVEGCLSLGLLTSKTRHGKYLQTQPSP